MPLLHPGDTFPRSAPKSPPCRPMMRPPRPHLSPSMALPSPSGTAPTQARSPNWPGPSSTQTRSTCSPPGSCSTRQARSWSTSTPAGPSAGSSPTTSPGSCGTCASTPRHRLNPTGKPLASTVSPVRSGIPLLFPRTDGGGSPAKPGDTATNKEAGWGRIVNVSSVIVARPDRMIRGNAYAVAKAALEAHTVNPAAELRGSGVTVNAYRPGGVDTAMQAWIRQQEPERIGASTVWHGCG
jgi:hypothetical protein